MKQLKIFLTKIRSTVPLLEAPLVRPKDLTKGREGEVGFVNVFHQNLIIFYTSNFLYPPPVPTYYFCLAYSYFHLHIHWPIIYVIFSFGRIKIDIIIYESKRKTCINVLLSFGIHKLSFAHTLTDNSRHFFFWKDNNWHHYL